MSDPNLDDFYGRVARIERARALGHGFEAEGTLGRSAYARRRLRRRPVFRSTVFVLSIVVGLKAAAFTELGPDAYQTRVAEMRAGHALDRVTAVVMQADPLTVWLSVRIGWLLEQF